MVMVMVLVLVLVLVVLSVFLGATLVMWRQGRSHRSGAWARPLQGCALLSAVAATVAVWSTTWSDSGAFAILLLGVPVVLAAASEERRVGKSVQDV